MKKKYKQIKIQSTTNSNEFGIHMVPSEEAKLNTIVSIFNNLKYKIIEIWNFEIEVEIK
jgi:hypothetical protein